MLLHPNINRRHCLLLQKCIYIWVNVYWYSSKISYVFQSKCIYIFSQNIFVFDSKCIDMDLVLHGKTAVTDFYSKWICIKVKLHLYQSQSIFLFIYLPCSLIDWLIHSLIVFNQYFIISTNILKFLDSSFWLNFSLFCSWYVTILHVFCFH